MIMYNPYSQGLCFKNTVDTKKKIIDNANPFLHCFLLYTHSYNID